MKPPVTLHGDSYATGYHDGIESLRPLLKQARERIQTLTTWSHEYDEKCLCKECMLYANLSTYEPGGINERHK